jgi:hypothetical protein
MNSGSFPGRLLFSRGTHANSILLLIPFRPKGVKALNQVIVAVEKFLDLLQSVYHPPIPLTRSTIGPHGLEVLLKDLEKLFVRLTLWVVRSLEGGVLVFHGPTAGLS